MTTYTAYYSSPIGLIAVTGTETHITRIDFCKGDEKALPETPATPVMHQCITELEEYFANRLTTFTVPLQPAGTDFQKKVWEELMKIPHGKVISYNEMAKRLGDEKVIRAAASANGKNPIGILIPCHRVIGANGDLVGYAGGLDKKRLLLEHEGAIAKSLF
ncbi:MAG: methylated-DNA--[protein]-cysteine S-methyltransferase [Bacteroidetes bacterium]|nr:MAG: methylated-DNA--[protein]-cysteine S-methyltransferase [Bacteroidota bacterium]